MSWNLKVLGDDGLNKEEECGDGNVG